MDKEHNATSYIPRGTCSNSLRKTSLKVKIRCQFDLTFDRLMMVNHDHNALKEIHQIDDHTVSFLSTLFSKCSHEFDYCFQVKPNLSDTRFFFGVPNESWPTNVNISENHTSLVVYLYFQYIHRPIMSDYEPNKCLFLREMPALSFLLIILDAMLEDWHLQWFFPEREAMLTCIALEFLSYNKGLVNSTKRFINLKYFKVFEFEN